MLQKSFAPLEDNLPFTGIHKPFLWSVVSSPGFAGRVEAGPGNGREAMAIIGTHMLLYTPQPDALRVMLRDVFRLKAVDAGGGWLIFGLPPAELGVHPAEGPTHESGVHHQVTFMCDNIGKTMAQLGAGGVQFEGQPRTESYGITVTMVLPGGVKVMLYEPRHAMAIAPAKPKAQKRRAPGAPRRTRKTRSRARRK